MENVEFSTTIEINENPTEVYVTAEFHPATPQTEVDNTGTPEAVFLLTVTDVDDNDQLPYLGSYELDILKAEVTEHI